MLKYTRSSEDSRGLHIVFGEPITPANFLAACNAAIDLAKIECSTQTAVAIMFEAKGVEVQVTETDSAEVQLALWERKLAKYRDPNQVYETGSDDTFWYSKVIRDSERFNVLVYDADGDRRPEREDSFADQVLSVAFADQAVLRVRDREVSNYIEHPGSGKTGTFAAKYDQHAERNGQTFTVLGTVDPATYDAEECGTMYCIRFADGAEIEAWPEEVETAIVARSPVDCLCQSGHNPT